MFKSICLIVFVLIGSAHNTLAADHKLRGSKSQKNPSLKQRHLKTWDCDYDPVLHPIPTEPCPSDLFITFERRRCAWVCKPHPTNYNDPDQEQPPANQPKPEPPALEAQEPTIPPASNVPTCPEGEVPILDYYTKKYTCANPSILCHADHDFFYDPVQQTFFCVPSNAAGSTGSSSTAESRASQGGSTSSSMTQGCQYDPALHPRPSNCPANQTSFFNKWNCAWICMAPSSSSNPPAVSKPTGINCQANNVLFWDVQLGRYQCVARPTCRQDQYLMYNGAAEIYYCRNI